MKEKKPSIYDVANYFLYLSSPGTPRSITPLKLQKLTFYAQALNYAMEGEPLFDEDFEAWVHGPVSPELYYEYKNYGSREIDSSTIMKPKLDKKVKNVIKIIWRMYGTKDGKYLENKTHNEKPWQQARNGLDYYQHSNEIIDKTSIKNYYSKKFIVKQTKQ
ncbi:DUF4065 domain-containing protein [Bacillus thuringiensis]|uniref:Prophage protein (Ps3) n=2 Tax=Bacillus thuringiensis TaxID=1428 RepID=A0A9W3P0B3_BACTU|nr:type II toxin-antitoxin system antitoxin SocA domain-containing protein [Bacillus thuringiensis]AFQ18889.1 putative prophage protein (ps3) [Bacillus thuringiensis HD-771]MEB4890769.1 DUF4065 domain-containing protein [Bacillus thuringiensis]MEC2473975.1 DUF4065 domain-containing protein [Bacillus thuringiensis]MEC2562541.1 DUF4065 domain-containing protein [Bacillus thuringiensis]MEC2645800.1 DUF4065 domain-containing protein [Bacillus thuringiensis]